MDGHVIQHNVKKNAKMVLLLDPRNAILEKKLDVWMIVKVRRKITIVQVTPLQFVLLQRHMYKKCRLLNKMSKQHEQHKQFLQLSQHFLSLYL